MLASQMAMSEDDRKRIMDEHEKQMVALENSLALGKLRHRRLLEEKLAARKARNLQKMEQEHQAEAMVCLLVFLFTLSRTNNISIMSKLQNPKYARRLELLC